MSAQPPKGMRIDDLRRAYRELIVPVWERAGFAFAKGSRIRGVLPRGSDEYVLHVLPPYPPNRILEIGGQLRVSVVVTPIPKYLQHWGLERDVIDLCSEHTRDQIAALNDVTTARIWDGLKTFAEFEGLERLVRPSGGPSGRREELLRRGFVYFSRDDLAAWAPIFQNIVGEVVEAALDLSRFPRDEEQHALLEHRLAGRTMQSVLKKLKER